MNSNKKIEINQSSLLGLKAELLRKKNEVSSAKYSQQINPAKISTKKLTTKLDKTNEGVSERDKRDAEEFQEECDELKKSQKILEAKAKLYDKLANNVEGVDPEINVSGFLVDFKQKNSDDNGKVETITEEVESDYGEYSDEDDWVDFVDCLGRTKRCHKDDLQAMKEQDEKLRISLHGENKVKESEKESAADVKLPQLCSEDMKREFLRQKWEEQERNLLEKKNVHYQDVLFDEARTHGVGYYGFSTDEGERAKQQEELEKLRKETKKQQAETQTAAQRKQKQMAERLKAARRRKRERLGLPPEDDDEEKEEEGKEAGLFIGRAELEEAKPEPVEELRRDVRKPGPIRPWDIGKEKTPRILTQEEWIEKKRSERIDEFAPLPAQQPKEKPKKRPREQRVYPEATFSMEPMPIDDELEEKKERRGAGVEIPPPPTFEMYGPTSKPKRSFANMSQAEIDRSIEEGLNFLRRQVEAKQAKRREEEIDIMAQQCKDAFIRPPCCR